MSKLASTSLLPLLPLVILAACGGDDLEFTFDESTQSCVDSDGKAGRNEGVVQCGLAEDQSFDGEDFSGEDLRGLRLVRVSVKDCDSSGADLRYADLAALDVSNATFEKANLREAYLSAWESTPRDRAFHEVTFSENTVIKIAKAPLLRSAADDLGMKFEPETKNFQGASAEHSISARLPPSALALFEADLRALGEGLRSRPTPENPLSTAILNKSLASYFSERIIFVGFDTKAEDGIAGYNATISLFSIFFKVLESRMELSTKALSSLQNYLKDGKSLESFDWEMDYSFESNRDFFKAFNRTHIGYAAFTERGLGFSRSQAERVSTYIHEARHSDCPHNEDIWKKANASVKSMTSLESRFMSLRNTTPPANSPDFAPQLKALEGELTTTKADYEPFKQYMLDDKNLCFHFHADCPASKGEGLAGFPACDSHPWGSYSISVTMAKHALQTCTNCKESTKAVYAMMLADALDRWVGEGEMLPARDKSFDDEQMRPFEFDLK